VRGMRLVVCAWRIAAATVTVAVAVSLPPPGAGASQTVAFADLLSQVSGRRAYEHVRELSQRIGPHVAGTLEDRTSGVYIAGQLARDGYAVEWQAFQFPFFAVRAVALTMPSQPSLDLHPHTMLYSASTPPGGITANLVDVGLGRPEDLRGKSVAGKIALILRGSSTFAEKARNAAEAGAVGALIYNAKPEEFGGVVGRGTSIPVVSLSGAEGQRLLDLVHAGAITVHLNVQTVREERTTWNIIGTKPGTRDPHRVLVVGAHRDTVEGAPGANDNSSGVAVALEVANVLQHVPLALTVRFVFFGAEEEGLYGSDYYVHHMGPDHVIGMVNLDMEGVGERVQLARHQGPDDLVRAAARLADQLGIRVTVAPSAGSDHVHFERVGVPVVFVFRPDDPYFDTPKDTADRVDPRLLEVSARLAAAIVLDTASAGR
jgi:aminopeptidase YwaD